MPPIKVHMNKNAEDKISHSYLCLTQVLDTLSAEQCSYTMAAVRGLYSCNFCDAKFPAQSDIKEHILRFHQEELSEIGSSDLNKQTIIFNPFQNNAKLRFRFLRN